MAPAAAVAASTERRSSSVSFRDVEVIELPIVPGADHPTNSQSPSKVGDSAAITVGWKPQSRTTIDVDTYENSKQEKSKNNKGRKGGLRRIFLPRAVRKRM